MSKIIYIIYVNIWHSCWDLKNGVFGSFFYWSNYWQHKPNPLSINVIWIQFIESVSLFGPDNKIADTHTPFIFFCHVTVRVTWLKFHVLFLRESTPTTLYVLSWSHSVAQHDAVYLGNFFNSIYNSFFSIFDLLNCAII